jgi:hypothetical protein
VKSENTQNQIDHKTLAKMTRAMGNLETRVPISHMN